MIFIILFLIFNLTFLYGACKVSSDCSQKEEFEKIEKDLNL